MKRLLTLKKDYYAGALMIFIGLSAAWSAHQHTLGSLAHMGPGFFPMAVGLLLAATGLLIALAADDKSAPAADGHGHGHGLPDLRGNICLILGTLAFIVLGKYTGLLPATFAIVFISALGDRDNTVLQALWLSLAMMVVATVVFWWALSLQMPLLHWGG